MRPAHLAGLLGPGFSDEALALFARMSSPPDSVRKSAINTLIGSLKSAGAWSKLDVLQVYAAADSQAALLNWMSSSYDASVVSSPTFEADRGFKTNGSSSYINTGWNPGAGVNFTQDSSTFGLWSGYSGLSANSINGSWGPGPTPRSGCSIQLIGLGYSSIAHALNHNQNYATSQWNTPTTSGHGGHGVHASARTGSSAQKNYAQGLPQSTTTAYASVTRNSRNLFLGALNHDGSPSTYAAWQFGAFFAGDLSDAQLLALSDALTIYMQAVGNWSTPIVGWGDSLSNNTYYTQAALRAYANIKPWRRAVSQGVSAQTSTQISARVVADTAYTGNDFVHVIWMGRNDIANSTQTVDSTTIKAQIAASVAAVAARSNKYIVLGLTPANLNAPGGSLFSNSEATGTTIGTAIATHNSDLATLYGSRFLDIRQALIDYTTANLSGTDLTDAGNGLPGRTLYANDGTGVHFGLTQSSAGHVAVGQAIEDKIEALGW